MKTRTLSLASAAVVCLGLPAAAHATGSALPAASSSVGSSVPAEPASSAGSGASSGEIGMDAPDAAPIMSTGLTQEAMLGAAQQLGAEPVYYAASAAFSDEARFAATAAPDAQTLTSAETQLALAADMSPEQLAQAQAVLASVQYSGAEPSGGREPSYTVLLSQDSFFGFYPSFNGLIPIGDNVDFSFYGILWTTDAFGTGLGSDLWTEFGVGVNIITMDGNLTIKPQLGLTNGALLSGGVRDEVTDLPTGTGGNFADGIVPSLTMNYSDDSFEAEFYGGYYAALRNRNEPGANDFLHTWINAGAKITPNFSAGAHYELLSLTRSVGGNDAVVYQWVGPYVQFSTGNGFFARFTAGPDIEDGNDGDFYKLTAGFSF